MNGGFSHSLEVDVGQALRAAQGFRLFGHDTAAGLIDRGYALVAPLADGDRDLDLLDLPEPDKLDAAYDAQIDDSEVERYFTVHLAAHPEDFAAP
jgi:hypothetical protein